MAKPVFLVGYMGSGKTTVGKKLATKLKCKFLDTDHAIEEMTGKSITQIFNEDGEDAFRQLERSILVSLTSRQNIVISTGGGTPCYFDNMALMNRHGITVYIKLHPASLSKRIMNSDTERPLLRQISNEDLPTYISIHLKERESFYSKAHIIIKGESIKIDELNDLIINHH